MILAMTFYPHERVFVDSPVELLSIIGIIATLATIIAAAITAYRHIECHQEGCHRLGRFPHGHFKLCAVHKPGVPSDGKITAEHVQAVTANLEMPRPQTILPADDDRVLK